MSAPEREVEQRPAPPTLADCADEPIHIPGAVQPHGALLAFEGERLIAWSATAPALLGVKPRLGAALGEIELGPELSEGLAQLLQEPGGGDGAATIDDARHGGREYARVVHRYDGRDLVEFEARVISQERSHPGTGAERSWSSRLFTKLRNELDLTRALRQCTEQIRQWTGFDRVMAYVFQRDASGDVVAESRCDEIDSFLNMRFPASDIPAQARRLYTLNTLRLIPDVSYTPVALLSRAGDRPVDLSFAVLRSVSPIHVEYLQNMGVGASMSVSIVVEGRLWGLFACHHRSALFVPPEARQACDLLAQFVSSRVQAIQARTEAISVQETAEIIPQLIGALTSAEDPLLALVAHEQALRRLLRAEAIVLTAQGKVIEFGGISHATAIALSTQLPVPGGDPLALERREDWPEALRSVIGEWVGALDIEFDRLSRSRIIALRREQISTVRWGGKPEKILDAGPSGPRLTPRGSFAEWRESVRDQSLPWLDVTVRVARQLQHELARVASARYAEIEEARRHMLAVLGHDLRDPLHTIRMAASMLERDERSRAWGTRIDKSSSRMQRLITAVLDFSRAEAGLPIVGELAQFDFAEVVDDLVVEARVGHPGVEIHARVQKPAVWYGDKSRIAQALSNLLSNARHHGEAGKAIEVSASADHTALLVEVRNSAPPIPPEVARNLFAPFKQREHVAANRTGLGIGLYIAHHIARASNGTLDYRHEQGMVVFTLRLKAGAPPR
jgi:light-regulated signal transduction histidine kinase (bacteriophytochrome)